MTAPALDVRLIGDRQARLLMLEYPDQVKFAWAIAANRTVEEALAGARAGIQARMHVRVPRFTLPPTQLPAVWRATKQRQSAVFGLGEGQPGGIGYRRQRLLAKFEGGGLLHAKDVARFPLAIPTQVVRSSPAAPIPKRLLPRNLVGAFDSKGQFQGLTRRSRIAKGRGRGHGRQVGRYFVLGHPGLRYWGIYERTGSRKGDIRPLWWLRQSERVPNILGWERALATALNRWEANLTGALEYAVKTRRQVTFGVAQTARGL